MPLTISEELLNIKKNLDELKTERAQVEGRIQEGMRRLEASFNVTTIEEAETLAAKLQKQMDELDTELESRLEELKKRIAE